MGLTTGKWRFDERTRVPSVPALAKALAGATGLHVNHTIGDVEHNSRIEVPVIRAFVFDIEPEGSDLGLLGPFTPHPYLWENLDRVLEGFGGRRVLDESNWAPDARFQHLRKPWAQLSARQRLLLRFPTIGPARYFDRFV